jgi:hypothetical protein
VSSRYEPLIFRLGLAGLLLVLGLFGYRIVADPVSPGRVATTTTSVPGGSPTIYSGP